jgi:hypothetical protein
VVSVYRGNAENVTNTGMIGNPQIIPTTRRQRLEQQKEQLQQALGRIEKAIAALDAHPDLEEFAEALARAGV